jgi:hypothetical protein
MVDGCVVEDVRVSNHWRIWLWPKESVGSRITVLLTCHLFLRYPNLTHAFSASFISSSFQDRVLTAF